MILKWIFDRVVSFIGLLFLWPVLLVVAVLIKMKMPGGPVLFVQKRVGKDGKLFKCHKFRTMVNNDNVDDNVLGCSGTKARMQSRKNDDVDDNESRALKARRAAKACTNDDDDDNLNANDNHNLNLNENQNQNQNQKGGWSTVSVAGDSRITPLGAKLRHYKLDELPGLWDVLIGNMSFVGPRPDVPGYADKLVGEDRDVLKLRPGITGPATLKYRLEDEYLANARELVSNANPNVLGCSSTTPPAPEHQLERKKARVQSRKNFNEVRSKTEEGRCLPKEEIDRMTDQELAVWYNDNVIYPDKVRLNLYYYRHYSFWKDIEMILCTVLGRKMKYNNEII